jgi:hypothetical protein
MAYLFGDNLTPLPAQGTFLPVRQLIIACFAEGSTAGINAARGCVILLGMSPKITLTNQEVEL